MALMRIIDKITFIEIKLNLKLSAFKSDNFLNISQKGT